MPIFRGVYFDTNEELIDYQERVGALPVIERTEGKPSHGASRSEGKPSSGPDEASRSEGKPSLSGPLEPRYLRTLAVIQVHFKTGRFDQEEVAAHFQIKGNTMGERLLRLFEKDYLDRENKENQKSWWYWLTDEGKKFKF